MKAPPGFKLFSLPLRFCVEDAALQGRDFGESRWGCSPCA
jgi:hypothetical protein